MRVFIYLTPLLLLIACERVNYPIVTTSSCAIDNPIKNSSPSATRGFNISGWAYDKRTGTVPERIRIQFVSSSGEVSKVFDAKRGTKRPDVAKVFNLPELELSGFDFSVPANTIVPGSYEISVLQDLPNAILVCSNVNFVKIR